MFVCSNYCSISWIIQVLDILNIGRIPTGALYYDNEHQCIIEDMTEDCHKVLSTSMFDDNISSLLVGLANSKVICPVLIKCWILPVLYEENSHLCFLVNVSSPCCLNVILKVPFWYWFYYKNKTC